MARLDIFIEAAPEHIPLIEDFWFEQPGVESCFSARPQHIDVSNNVVAALSEGRQGLQVILSPDYDWRWYEAAWQNWCAESNITATLKAKPLVEKDWLKESDLARPVLKLGPYTVFGAHHNLKVDRTHIHLDAATAFGTGLHPTTRQCAELYLSYARLRRFKNVLDLGAGSGLLAFIAAKHQKTPVLATDNDPEAVRVARHNAHLNGLKLSVRLSHGFRRIRKNEVFDLIFANILAKPLCGLAKPLARHLKPGGIVILSGLLNVQARQVLAAYRAQGLSLQQKRVAQNWVAMTVGRKRR